MSFKNEGEIKTYFQINKNKKIISRHTQKGILIGIINPPLGKMRPLPATASQGKSPVPP